MKKKEAKKMSEKNIRNLDKKEPKMEKKRREPMKKGRK
jgi:hypothetical protein